MAPAWKCVLLLLFCSLYRAEPCVPQMNLLDPCTGDGSCTSVAGKCVSGKCACPDGFQAQGNVCAEIPKMSTVLGSCDLACPAYSSCVSGKCQCNDGSVAATDNSQCYPRGTLPQLGQQCSDSCEGSFVECKSAVCVCQTGFTAAGSKCRLDAKLVADTCTVNIQCPVNSNCASGTCKCPTGYKQTTNKNGCIVDRTKIGGTCLTTVQCPINGQCDDSKKCICLRGYRANGDYSCVAAKTSLQQSCEVASECGINAVCQSKCMCVGNEYAAIDNDIDCDIKHVKLGEYCYQAVQCPSNSYCDKKTCKCKQGFVETSGMCAPVPPVAVGADCTGVGEFCPANGYCNFYNETDAYCTCKPGYSVSVDQLSCVPMMKKVAETCEANGQCPVNGVCTRDSFCACIDDYEATANNTACIQIAHKLRETCAKPSHCIGDPVTVRCDATCSTCLCQTGYEEIYGVCVARTPPTPDSTPKSPFQRCANDGQCANKDANSYCNDVYKLCMCKPGYTYSEQSKTCALNASKLYETCNADEQCAFANSDCIDNVCRCKMGYYLDVGSCVLDRLASFDDSCLGDDQCPGENVVCFLEKALCKCKEAYVIDPNTRTCKFDSRAVDHECYTTLQCPSNAECKQEDTKQVCRCRPGFLLSDDGATCDPPHVGANCTNYVCVKNAQCLYSTCTCSAPFVGMDGLCLHNIGTACSDSSDCAHIDDAECSKTTKTCECKEGFKVDELEYEINQCAVMTAGTTTINAAPIFATTIALLLLGLQQ